jgi:putative glycosyltransferase (exosortase G-associated)
MTVRDALAFMFVWGVWLITPILFDGIDTVSRLFTVWRTARQRRRQRAIEDWELPRASVIVPCHNEEAVIDRCLNSIKAQDYPSDKLEIIVVDDGSTDETAERVEAHVNGTAKDNGFRLRGRPIKVGPFDGTLILIKNGHAGKAHSLNAGIAVSNGEIVINIDSDVVLAFDAVRRMAETFVREPSVGAVTGNIEIDWDVLEARNEDGSLALDDNGDIVAAELSPMQRFLGHSQFLEYLSAFDLGRRSQAATGTVYTLAGACSAFRRTVLAEGVRYENSTVSEDTDMTFELHRRNIRVGFSHDARVYLEPVVEWDGLYAQRVRWARGQVEVIGRNSEYIGSKPSGRFGRIAIPKMLLFDHTVAFPRLIWAPLLLFFPLMGYSLRVVGAALVAMYLFYLFVEIVNAVAVHTIADDHTRARLAESAWAVIGMPLYRFCVFHFRFSGFLVAHTEEQKWTVSGPVQTARRDFNALRLKSIQFAGMLATVIAAVGIYLVRNAQALLGPALAGALVALREYARIRRWW